MRAFWGKVGKDYCNQHDYRHVNHHDEIMRHEFEVPSLLIINTDDSTSMQWKDFEEAVKGAKQAVQFVKDHHSLSNEVDVQLWWNNRYGVSCSLKTTIDNVPLSNPWDSPHQPRHSEKNYPALVHHYGREKDWRYKGQFGGSLNILNKEVMNILIADANKYEVIYYFMFTDGDSSFPTKELDLLCSNLK